MLDRETLQVEFNVIRDRLSRYAFSIVRDWHDAEDVLQEVQLKVSQCQSKQKIARAWLYRVTRNQAIDLYRRRKRRREVHGDDLAAVPCQAMPGGEGSDELLLHEFFPQVEGDAQRSYFLECKNCLTPNLESLFTKAILGYDVPKILWEDGITEATYRARRSELRKALKALEQNRLRWRTISAALISALRAVQASSDDPLVMWDVVALLHEFEPWLSHPIFSCGIIGACVEVVKRCGPGSVRKGFEVNLADLSEHGLFNLERLVLDLTERGIEVCIRFLNPGEGAVGLDYLPGLFCGIGQHSGFEGRASRYAHLFECVGQSTKRNERAMILWPPVFAVPKTRATTSLSLPDSTVVVPALEYTWIKEETLLRGTGDIHFVPGGNTVQKLDALYQHFLAAHEGIKPRENAR